MIYTLSNDKLTVKVDTEGAQLTSIQTNCDQAEYLWQADPTYWGMHATVLFPICGRLFEGKYTWQGSSYEMAIHGIVKNAPFHEISLSQTSLTLEIRSDETTKASYPFDFAFRVTYTLDGLTVTEHAEAINTGKGDLPVAFGGHPGFNVPLGGQGAFEDYYVEFPSATSPRRLLFSPTCFLTGGDEPWNLENGTVYHLHHDMFDDDAVFIKNMADSVTLKSKATTKSVTVSYPGFRFLGFWHRPKTQAPYICIEPWYGIPSTDGHVDDFKYKQAMDLLSPGQKKDWSFSIAVTE